MNTKRTGAILLSALLLVSAVVPAAVTAQTDESLSLGVTQDETGSVTISVTDNGTAVENATVNVTADGNGTYAGAGEHETGANGTVSLQAPAEPVTVSVEASYNGTTTTTTVDLEPALGVEVDGAADGSVVVTVTRGNATVEDATVNVTANTTYANTGEFKTGANGTVTLANPDETVELTITATDENDTAATSVVVEPVQTLAVGVDQADDGTVTVSVGRLGEPVANATVDVTSDAYAATGEYETDETGTVVLPAPSENVTVTVTATKDGDTATTTADLEPPEPVGPFGQIVSAFVDALKGAGFTGIGSQVSDFVTSNNPSNAGNSEAVGNDAPVTPAAGNNAPITPPGQEKKDDNESRIVPNGPPVDNPGQSNESNPGNSGSAPGQSGGADDSPGNSGSAPGQSGDADDEGDGADDSPGNSGSAPGQSGDADDEGDGADDSPGNSGSAPGQSGDADDGGEDDGDDSSDDSDSDSDDSGEGDDAGSSGNGNSNGGGGNGNGNGNGNGGGNGPN